MTAPRIISNAEHVTKIIQLAGRDPEASHGDIDAEVEQALRDIVAQPNDRTARENAERVIALLDIEEREGWDRWYA